MGRQGPRLVPFLQDGLINKKYRNLISEDTLGLIFSIILPHKTKKLDADDEFIFKDWYALNRKKYIVHSKHYTDAKQAITASLRKSDYVEKIHISDDKLTYRILSKAEVKEKKRLKKEQKKLKEVKKEATDSDDASSSVESGYGSEVDSPRNNTPVLLDGNIIPPSVIESSLVQSPPVFRTMNTDSLIPLNDVLLNTCSGKFGLLKSEIVDASISAENSLADPVMPILFEVDSFTNMQPYIDNLKLENSFPQNFHQPLENLKSEDYFSQNFDHPAHGVNLMDWSSDTPEFGNSGFVGSLPFENDLQELSNLSDEDLNNLLFKDVPAFNSNPLECEAIVNNQAVETQNGHQMPTEPKDILTEELWNKLVEVFPVIDDKPFVAFEGESRETTPDAGLPEAEENIYLCKECVHLGKIPILFCEPQFKKSSEVSGELKIAFEEAVLKEISGFKSVKEYKFIDDHLMVILEPNDE
ncbi:unnamed protein product [Larinioides sclopetarius]|uniref:Uncharacterized protein n=1 Tax=Larinioides sclopetarius TaxID=280406 RepID=A0AAV2B1P4_9ARAC